MGAGDLIEEEADVRQRRPRVEFAALRRGEVALRLHLLEQLRRQPQRLLAHLVEFLGRDDGPDLEQVAEGAGRVEDVVEEAALESGAPLFVRGVAQDDEQVPGAEEVGRRRPGAKRAGFAAAAGEQRQAAVARGRPPGVEGVGNRLRGAAHGARRRRPAARRFLAGGLADERLADTEAEQRGLGPRGERLQPAVGADDLPVLVQHARGIGAGVERERQEGLRPQRGVLPRDLAGVVAAGGVEEGVEAEMIQGGQPAFQRAGTIGSANEIGSGSSRLRVEGAAWA